MKTRNKLVALLALLAVVGVLAGTPSQTWAVGGGCTMSFCTSVSQCNCPSAQSVACVNNVCQYTYGPGPGGGGSQGCPMQRFCVGPQHCVFGSIQGTCVNSVCVC